MFIGHGKNFFSSRVRQSTIFTLGGFIDLMTQPLKNVNLWRPDNLDINHVFIMLTNGATRVITNKLFKSNKFKQIKYSFIYN